VSWSTEQKKSVEPWCDTYVCSHGYAAFYLLFAPDHTSVHIFSSYFSDYTWFFYFDDNLQFIPFSWPKLLQEGHSFYLHPNLTCGIWNILSWAGVNLWISVCMKYTMDWRAVGVGYFSYFAVLVHFSPFLPKQCGLDDVESHQGKFLPLFCHKFIWKLK
jgi:hypothetical protein